MNVRIPRVVSPKFAWLAPIVLVLGLLTPAQPARAATFEVSNLDNSGAGSLRQAILDANATPEADTITFSVSGTITLTGGELTVSGDLTIDGPGPAALTISGNDTSRVFYIAGGAVTVAGVTIGGGSANLGGGIRNAGSLTLVDSLVSGNAAVAASGNRDGGGLYNAAGGSATITNSTVVGNSADYGAGLYNNGSMTISNSTISGNRANVFGGGIQNWGTLSIASSTITGNTTDGIQLSGVNLALRNSIVAGNPIDIRGQEGTINSAGYNLIGTLSAVTLGGNLTGNQIGVDPRLAPLQNNGGATFTHALLPDSPAIDQIPESSCPDDTDQRGAHRPTNGDGSGTATCDVGAYEVGAVTANTTVSNVRVNGGGSTAAVEAGASFSVALDYHIIDAECPNCIDQIQIGFSNENPQRCAYSGIPGTAGVTSSATVILSAPTTPGTYFVAFDRGQDFSCFRTRPTWWNGTPAATAYIATITVDLPLATNTGWTDATELTLTPLDTNTSQATANQVLYRQDQSAWFKFSAPANSKLIVQLGNLPANYDLILYKDIAAAYDYFLSPRDPLELSTRFAPLQYSPLQYSPLQYSPLQYSPLQYSPLQYSPLQYSPLQYSPLQYSPLQYSPLQYSPLQYSPLQYSPSGYEPQAFGDAQLATMLAISAEPGTGNELIVRNTWNDPGDYYIRVRGRDGTFSSAAAFQLQITALGGSCVAVNPLTHGPLSAPGTPTTLLLTDRSRIPGSTAEKNSLASALTTFAGRVDGVVVDLAQDSIVQAANAQADRNLNCPYAKNVVASTIKELIDAHRNPDLKYVVLAGGDDVIPFWREVDAAQIAKESQFSPPVLDDSASQASLKNGYVLSQDRYGSALEILRNEQSLPFPGLAVGRLVETISEITGQLGAYPVATNGVIPSPGGGFSSLVTGYDFLEDAANAIRRELETATGTTADTLISRANVLPSASCPDTYDPNQACSWTAKNLRDKLLGSRHDLMFLGAHFNAAGVQAADRSELETSEVLASPVDLTNAIIFSEGCHSGYNIVDDHNVPGVTVEPDWAQTLAGRKHAVLIAGTGYQYGDTDFLEYGERLYLEFAKQLRAGTGAVALGPALVEAKRAYLAGTPELSGVHDKTVLQATLFGLPMLSVNLPNGRGTPPAAAPLVTTLTGNYADVTLSATAAGAALTQEPVERTVPIINTQGTPSTADDSTDTASYLEGPQGVVTNPNDPVLPLAFKNATLSDRVLRGVGFRGGSYTDLPNRLPLTGAAVTEDSVVRTPFRSDVFYPLQPWRVNYLDALDGGTTRLNLMQAQYKSNPAPDELRGTVRKYTATSLRLYYSDDDAAIAVPPPIISDVLAASSSGAVVFTARVTSAPSSPPQDVWITYTLCSATGCDGSWRSIELERDGSAIDTWTATLRGVTPSNLRYMVQAANSTGLVALDTNLGAYYTPDILGLGVEPPTPAQPLPATRLSFEAPTPNAGSYGAQVTLKARLVAGTQGLDRQTISFVLGSQIRRVATDADGYASVTVPLLDLPDRYDVSVAYRATADYQGSSASQPFVLGKQPTTLTLSGATAAIQYGDESGTVARLRDSTGQALANKTVFFVVSGNGLAFRRAATTDVAGDAALGAVPLPAGSYAVTASFGGTIELPDGSSTSLSDDLYADTTANGTLSMAKEKAATSYTGDRFVLTTGPSVNTAAVRLAARVTQEADGTPGELARAQVRFELFKASNTGTTPDRVSGPVAVDAAGNAQTTLDLGVDIWTVRVKIEAGNPYWQAEPVGSAAISVAFKNTAKQVAGAGWVADSGSVDGKGVFAFGVTYRNGSPVGTSAYSFRSSDNFIYAATISGWQGGGLGVFADRTIAAFSGKCVITKVNPANGAIVATYNNNTCTVHLVDGDLASPRRPDRFALTILDGNNNVWRQIGTAIAPLQLGSGTVAIGNR